jgi:mRNA-degrading endonuclease RelE of RelBE toxin-antitoxin system
VRRFPYVVVYRIDDEQITVVAVYHTSRNPRGWRRRGG